MSGLRSALQEVRWIDLPSVDDPRGTLTAAESQLDVPFDIQRVFFMHHVTASRGGHAHRDTDQVVIAVAGRFKVELFDGEDSASYVLDRPNRGLYVPRMVLVDLDRFSPDAVCLVLASTHYDMSRSLRTRADFLQAISEADS